MTEEYVSHPTQWKLIAVAVAALLTAGIAGFQVMDGHIESLRKQVGSLQIAVAVLSVEMREAHHVNATTDQEFLANISAAYAYLDSHHRH